MHVPCLPLCNLEPIWGFFSLSFSLYATSSLSYCRILTTFSLLLVQPFKRYVEIGRVAQINYGKEYGRLIVIVDVIDQNKMLRPSERRVHGAGNSLSEREGHPSMILIGSR
ncbi:hypothetical protein JHK87_040005 [Glycine soja]|nr:hypothetical protein JHK87_040005 [Glycine soja]